MQQIRSIRFRITALATAVVAVVLVVGGVALVLLQQATLTSTIDDALGQRADDITALVESGAVPDPLPEGAGEGFAQLVGQDGSVLVSTPNLTGVPPLAIPAGAEDRLQTLEGLAIEDDAFRVLSRQIEGVGTLHVGTSGERIAESTEALIRALAVIIPILVLALATLIWWLVGRTLRPVEDIRSEVAAIGSTDLYRRVPEPETGDEIDRLAETMNEMLARLEASVERQQVFVADASHELRSPLTRMRSALEVELAENDPEWRDTLQGVLDDVVEMQRVAEDLLYLARADEGRIRRDFRPIDLDDLVLAEARLVQASGGVKVDLSAVSGAHVVGDGGQLTRAVRNLLDNASRHADSKVTIRLQESGDDAVLIVANDGPGIAPEDAERIFARFGRLDEARAEGTGGVGLGLAIARDIAERHGGSLTLDSTGDPGAAFELRLPRAT